MGKHLGRIAADVVERWLKSEARRTKKGLAEVECNFENLRDFASLYTDELDCTKLDMVAEQAVQKILNYRLHAKRDALSSPART